MEPVFFVMAILGCGDNSIQQCSEQRVLPARYISAAACQAAMPAMLARNTDVNYPEIAAACRANGPRMVQASTTPRG